jgi:hypothetical protein
MSEWTARHDDSKILQRVRSAQVVSLGSYGSSAKSPVTETRKSDQIRRPHLEYIPQRGNYFDNFSCAVLLVNRRIIFTIVNSCFNNMQASQFIALTFAKGQPKTSEHEIAVVR